MRSPLKLAALVAAASFLLAPSAQAQDVIISPVDGVVDVGGPGVGPLSQTYDQSGLTSGFTSGSTLFDSYLSGDPRHTALFSGYEWFSNSGLSSAQVTYDLGSVRSVSRLALWNEESSGIGSLDLYGSVDGSSFFSLALGLAPTDHPLDAPADEVFYPADVFSFGGYRDVRYVRFEMSGCPQPDPADYSGCAIGEVAFAEGSGVVSAPEPASAALVLTGLLGFAAVRRRRDDDVV